MSMKQMVLGTSAGRAAMWMRETTSLIAAAIARSETLGTRLNDSLATCLVTRLPCNRFVDVGAHIGSIVTEVLRNTSATVIAIEAMPDKAAALRRKFKGLTVHACAVGDSEGDVSFFVVPAASGYSSLIRSRDSVEITVPLRRLDDLVTEPVEMIKIDVEGAELGVLRGADRLIASSRPVIMFESAPGEAMYSKAAMWEWLAERQYEVVVPDRVAHEGPPLSRDGFAESHYYPRRTTNYFAIPAERRNEVRAMARQVLGITVPARLEATGGRAGI